MAHYGIMLPCMALCGLMWPSMTLCGLIWFCVAIVLCLYIAFSRGHRSNLVLFGKKLPQWGRWDRKMLKRMGEYAFRLKESTKLLKVVLFQSDVRNSKLHGCNKLMHHGKTWLYLTLEDYRDFVRIIVNYKLWNDFR